MVTSTELITLLINDYQFNINSISMYYNQTILNSDRYSLYITIIKSDNNMTTEALKHYKGEREGGERKRGNREGETEIKNGMRMNHRRLKEEQERFLIVDMLQLVSEKRERKR